MNLNNILKFGCMKLNEHCKYVSMCVEPFYENVFLLTLRMRLFKYISEFFRENPHYRFKYILLYLDGGIEYFLVYGERKYDLL